MRFILALAALAFLFSAPLTSANAGEAVACGVPLQEKMPTEAGNFCDIHQRRLAYRDDAEELKAQMQERARNFAAPRRAAYEQYLKDLEDLNERRGSSVYIANTDDDASLDAEPELIEMDDTDDTDLTFMDTPKDEAAQ